jgi:hypothetical protein
MVHAVAGGRNAARQKKKRPRLRRWLLGIAVASIVGVIALWIAVHRVEWLGPLVANTLRKIIGTDNVAKLEDFAYAVEDRVNRIFKKDEPPKAYWKVPPKQPEPPPPAAPVAASGAPPAPALPPFEPKNPGPALKAWSAPGDGQWVRMVDPRRPNEAAYMYKTLLHPDKNRGWAEVFVVAVDLRRVRLHIVAGSQEPKADSPAGEKYERHPLIPKEHQEDVLAAFNGGFMTEHGGYGMKIDNMTLVSAKPNACTIAAYKDDSLRIATWKHIANTESEMLWLRQAPECMIENAKLHPGLLGGKGLKWGATLDGDTVIRRSAIGLSADRQVLYVSITNHSTARVLADGMQHAGAVDVAQLDVNWSYPKFVTFEPRGASGERKAVALAEGFEYSEDEYLRKKQRRDFFYLMRKDPAPKP